MSNFTKLRPVGAELFHADGQTGMTKPTVAFRNFANAPKNSFTRTFQLTNIGDQGYGGSPLRNADESDT
jgi:hypothetical protein